MTQHGAETLSWRRAEDSRKVCTRQPHYFSAIGASFTRPKMVYIRQDKLPKLKEYKYSGVDHSLLSRYVLKPFYTKFVINLFPMSMA